MTRFLSLFLVSVLAFTLISTAQAEPNSLAVIVVDDAHQNLQIPGQPPSQDPGKSYFILPCRGLVLDLSQANLRFQSGSQRFNLVKPNRIDLIVNPHNQRFKKIFSSKTKKLVLDADSLRPVGETGKFKGFQGGESFLISIGFEFPRKSTEKVGKVAPVWMGVGRVKDPASPASSQGQ